ncbi:MAG: F0F1 ATP synthase subunit A [Candidatus Kerfeldbacteria bacterium]|nr:F0F1 ATP synthase subunit A [Candidatus Kerfeldbacteria bacterium]
MAEISIAPEILGHIGALPITNTLWLSLAGSTMLIIIALVTRRSLREVPKGGQVMMEAVIGGAYSFVQSVTQNEKITKRYFPYVMTVFLFFLTCNMFAFIPVLPVITLSVHGHAIPIFRLPTSDYNLILAVTGLSFLVVQISSFTFKGLGGYLHQFFNFSSPINFFVGILELIGELARVLSLSARLFGNMFAEEVLAVVITLLAPVFAPVPFHILGFAVSIIQPVVFSLLVLIFVKLALTEQHH